MYMAWKMQNTPAIDDVTMGIRSYYLDLERIRSTAAEDEGYLEIRTHVIVTSVYFGPSISIMHRCRLKKIWRPCLPEQHR